LLEISEHKSYIKPGYVCVFAIDYFDSTCSISLSNDIFIYLSFIRKLWTKESMNLC